MKTEIANIPKTEMHLHIEGAIRRDTYIELRRRDEPSFCLEQVPWYDDGYCFENLDHFLDTASPCVVKSPEDYKRLAFELFEDLLAQNVVYTEVTIASTRIPVGEITHAIYDAWQDVNSRDRLEYGILVGLFRSDPPTLAADLVKQAVESKRFNVVGVDLLEHETARSADAFTEAYGIAREAGLGLRAHAGEGSGSKSVWDVINALGVSRIAHGTRALEDPELVKYLAENHITLDMCPTSNYRLNVVDSIEDHPVRQLFDSGVRVTVSSDDPLFFNTDITGELMLLHKIFDFHIKEMRQLTRNAIDGAFLSSENKKRINRRLVS